MTIKLPTVAAALLFTAESLAQQAIPVWKNGAFSMYADSIVQGAFTAKALSATELTSNYVSPANAFKSPAITFKFSINGKDNEMVSGHDHHYNYLSSTGDAETPVIVFGQQFNDASKVPDNVYLPANAKLHIRVDMRAVLQAFKAQGYYTTFKGEKIYKEDFKGVYVAGNTAPLVWDFDNLVNHPQLQLKDDDGDGIYEATLVLNVHEDQPATEAHWRLTRDVSAFPQYHSDYPLMDAVYNLGLEEMQKAIEKDSTFRTGKEWAGVWTRDISYSIILSMAHMQPQVAKNSLLRKVNKRGRIIQDTGTGGAWPCSTDRMIWALAAWELYKATGDKDWLQQAYVIIKNSLDDDALTAYDPVTGLVKGESSFLDWREQTYPKWMQPADIFESECLGTNAVHYMANNVAGEMANLLHDDAAVTKYKAIANKIKAGINKYLWQPEKQYYAQYLYGRNYKMASPRSEALGEALCVLFGIAENERQTQVIAHTPVNPFGIPCIYPQIPGIPPYHNNAVWPFVQTFWMWASAKAYNEESVLRSMASIYRPAALFLTNKENLVAEDGDFAGTQINSSNMLWSLSGNISIVHKVLFGITYNSDGLVFKPFVPLALKGKRSLANFAYRDAVLNISMDGFGSKIKAITLDGKPLAKPEIPANLAGAHNIFIQLADNIENNGAVNEVINYTSIGAPTVSSGEGGLQWLPVPNATGYTILKNGNPVFQTTDTAYSIKQKSFSEYQVVAVDKKNNPSFASEPVVLANKGIYTLYNLEEYLSPAKYNYKGFTGTGFVEISRTVNTNITIPVTIDKPGTYAIECRYSNGNGPVNTENKCAIRTIKADGQFVGSIVFPQRGKEEWSNWGYTNSLQTYLTAGKHTIAISFEEYNENMNGDINQAMIDYVRVVRLK